MLEIPQNVPDEELVELLQTEEYREEAFAFLMDRYSPKLYNVVRRIVHRHEDTDDVLQSTFIKVWKNINTFRGDSKLSTWMYTIATNEALSHIRRERRGRKVPLTTEEYDLSETLVSDPYFDGSKAEADFLAAIDQLPEKQKLTFEYRYFEELPYKEIAEITGTSEGALKANYHHAVKKLQNFLNISEEED
ncbi:MAG: RNA polymerase sigma factor [Porphyromonas sp.]|nr:RNA polymerase sigma factor [Porphyromonas sp.]